jgi:hypothetical protein
VSAVRPKAEVNLKHQAADPLRCLAIAAPKTRIRKSIQVGLLVRP